MPMYRPTSAATLALALALATVHAAPARADLLRDLFLTPTYDERYVPDTYGTRYDCKTMVQKYGAANVWRGLVGGRKNVDMRTVQYSREGCFRTEAECKAFLTLISGYLLQTFTSQCRKGA